MLLLYAALTACSRNDEAIDLARGLDATRLERLAGDLRRHERIAKSRHYTSDEIPSEFHDLRPRSIFFHHPFTGVLLSGHFDDKVIIALRNNENRDQLWLLPGEAKQAVELWRER